MIKQIPFFKERIGNSLTPDDGMLDEKHIRELAINVKYVRQKKGETVFEYQSEGDLFYVILSGLVSVQTPITEFEVETYKRTATLRGKVTFFQTSDAGKLS